MSSQKKKKSQSAQEEPIMDMPQLLKALSKITADKRLELVRKHISLVYAADKKQMLQLYSLFNSAMAKIEIAICILQKPHLIETHSTFYRDIFQGLLDALYERMKITPESARKEFATRELQRVYTAQYGHLDKDVLKESKNLKQEIEMHVNKLLQKAQSNPKTLFTIHEKAPVLPSIPEGREKHSVLPTIKGESVTSKKAGR